MAYKAEEEFVRMHKYHYNDAILWPRKSENLGQVLVNWSMGQIQPVAYFCMTSNVRVVCTALKGVLKEKGEEWGGAVGGGGGGRRDRLYHPKSLKCLLSGSFHTKFAYSWSYLSIIQSMENLHEHPDLCSSFITVQKIGNNLNAQTEEWLCSYEAIHIRGYLNTNKVMASEGHGEMLSDLWWWILPNHRSLYGLPWLTDTFSLLGALGRCWINQTF